MHTTATLHDHLFQQAMVNQPAKINAAVLELGLQELIMPNQRRSRGDTFRSRSVLQSVTPHAYAHLTTLGDNFRSSNPVYLIFDFLYHPLHFVNLPDLKCILSAQRLPQMVASYS